MRKIEAEKIYVLLIDGTDVWVPVKAKQKQGNQYEILDDEEYMNLDPSELFEFYPGDIVEVEDSEDLDREYQYVAKRLISASRKQDRSYLEFKFKGTRRQLPINRTTAESYGSVIQRIKKEKADGQFFYKGILETVEMLEKLIAK